MEGWGQIRSQPSNFVSILDLRERWLKENERNQKQEEDLKKLELQEQQQNVQQTEPEEKDDQKPVVQKPRSNASSWSRNGSRNGSGKFLRYYRPVPVPVSNPCNVNATCQKTEDEGEPELAVPKIERDEKKKKKSKRKGRKKNPNAPKEEMDKASPTPEKNLKEEMKETKCEDAVQNGKKNVRARKIDEKKETVSQRGPEKTGCTHEMKEMENKLSLISVSFEIKRGRNAGVQRGSLQGNRNFGDRRSLDRFDPRKQRDVEMICVRKGNRNFGDRRNLDRWDTRKQRDDGMIWVRKDELSKVA